MNEFRCPCGYHASGSILGILSAADEHRPVCPYIATEKEHAK